MKALFSLATIAASGLAAGIELMLLHDTSESRLFDIDSPTHLQNLLKRFEAEFDDIKIAVADFSDKPNVHVGIGTYGGYPGPFMEDWCYRLERSLTSDMNSVARALQSLPRGSGLDVLEGNFEALIDAVVDTKVGWTSNATKVIMMVTDAMGHAKSLNTLNQHVLKFDTPVRCVGGETLTAGGIGAYETADLKENWLLPTLLPDYEHFADLVYHKTCVGDLSTDELAELEKLKITYGPLRVPNVKDFDIDVLKADPEEHCRYHEYPDYPDIVKVMDDFKLHVVLYDPTSKNQASWEWVLTDQNLGLGSVPNKFTFFTTDDGFEDNVFADFKALVEA